MTPEEIKEEVGILAVEPVEEVDDRLFYSALNRAIAQVNRIRPLVRSEVIHNRSLSVVCEQKKAESYGGEKTVVLSAQRCACFWLEVQGGGFINVKKGGETLCEIPLVSSKKAQEYRGVVSQITGKEKDDISLEITGAYAGTVVRAILYGEKLSNEEEDVPSDSLYNVYRLSDISADIQHITRLFYDDENKGTRVVETSDFLIPDGKELWIPKNKPGRYELHYGKKMKRLSVNEEKDEIELDADLQTLLPLLAGYYVWIEDKPELAEVMYAQYKQMEAEIRLESRENRYPAFQDVYGW